MGKSFPRLAGMALLMAFGLGAASGGARAENPWVWIRGVQPSLVNPEAMTCKPEHYNEIQFLVGCYDMTRGEWGNCATIFFEYYSLEGVSNSERLVWTGGHEHDRETGDPKRTLGSLSCPLDLGEGSDPKTFYGYTINWVWKATKVMPEASGVVRMRGWYRAENPIYQLEEANGWRYDPSDPTRRTVYIEVAFVVGIQGLEVLPDSEDYLKVSNHEGHSDPVFCGTPAMNQKLAQLASDFRKTYPSEGQISFNDLSLPYGGLYDVGQDWDCPHELHREGISADVNQTVPKNRLTALATKLGFTECHPNDPHIHLELGPCKRKRS